MRQFTDCGPGVAQVASLMGRHLHSLYAWLKKYGPEAAEFQAKPDKQAEINLLQ